VIEINNELRSKSSHGGKINCYIKNMSSHSTKTAGRSSKTARRPDKKSSKSARAENKKAAKSARRPVGKASRPTAATAIRAPSIAPRSAAKSGAKMILTPSPPVQPATGHDIAMMAHKYRVGETVYYTSPTFGRAAATGSYTVVKLLPSEGDDYQYRIKSSGEAFERVAKESQLDRI
jgi:hypothetical protein